MSQQSSTKHLVDELQKCSRVLGSDSRARKIRLMTALATNQTCSARLLTKLHSTLCFLRAFPDNEKVRSSADSLMQLFPTRIASLHTADRRALDETGMVTTTIHHEFSFDIAAWLTQRYPQNVSISWSRYEDPERLDAVLVHLVRQAEQQTWDDGMIGTQEWVEQAVGRLPATDLTWLLHQIRKTGSRQPILAALYDEAEVPIQWHLTDPCASKTFCGVQSTTPVRPRIRWRKPTHGVRQEIAKTCRAIKLLPKQEARDVIDVARTALAVRHREVYAMTYANCDEVYVASVGLGVCIAVMGVEPDRRLSLEGNYGYVILSNGIPIGYGGASPLFRQVNTGINIFDEFRHGESLFLFLQVLRVLRSLFRCTKFIANPYQFGAENDEALATGAFWFYYKIGFRPADSKVRNLAKKCATIIRKDHRNKPERATMKQLLSSDLTLVTEKHHAAEAFDERWLGVLATAATKQFAKQGQLDREAAAWQISRVVASDLGARQWTRWPVHERHAFENLAPVLAVIPDLSEWPMTAKQTCVSLIRAKGACCERDYVLRLARHRRLRHALAAICTKDQC